MNAKLDPHKKKILFRAGIISLKVLALVLVLESVFVNFANKVATVLVTGDTGVLSALRHQTAVLQCSSPRLLRLKQPDRLPWILLSRLWPAGGAACTS